MMKQDEKICYSMRKINICFIYVELRNDFSLPGFIVINTLCWRADCEVLIHDIETGVN